ncbi:MAG: hypothetical protein ABI550_07090 [Ignavibacteriaceae bacterium]
MKLTDLLRNSDDKDTKKWRDSLPDQFESWLKKMSPLDAIHYVKNSSAPIFFQYALNDEFNINKNEADKFFNSANEPKTIKFYPAKHDLNVEEAKEDRKDFILKMINK